MDETTKARLDAIFRASNQRAEAERQRAAHKQSAEEAFDNAFWENADKSLIACFEGLAKYLNENGMVAEVVDNRDGKKSVVVKGLHLRYRDAKDTGRQRNVEFSISPDNGRIKWEGAVPVNGTTQRTQGHVNINQCDAPFIERSVTEMLGTFLNQQ